MRNMIGFLLIETAINLLCGVGVWCDIGFKTAVTMCAVFELFVALITVGVYILCGGHTFCPNCGARMVCE